MKRSFVVEKLTKRYAEKKLAHLYLIRNFGSNDLFKLFYQDFAEKILNKKFSTHPDFLIVDVDEDESIYKVDSPNFQEFLRYLNYAPVNLSHKFIFINNAHLISEVLSNKMLKTFEELDESTTIFLNCPNNENILDTIKSRSIEIYLDTEQKLQEMTGQATQEIPNLLESFKDNDIDEKTFIELAIAQNPKANFQELAKLLDGIKAFNQGSIFNNSKNNNANLVMP